MKKSNKALLLTALALMIASVAMAVVETSFSSWNGLIQVSPDIIIAHCSRTPDPERDHGSGPTGPMVFSDIEVLSILKGAGVTNWAGGMPQLGTSRLVSTYYPRQGEYYLVFSIYHDGEHQASEKYRVVPLGLDFSTNSLSGKTLDAQIQMLLQRRLNDLNRQMKEEHAEKQRLEEAFQN